MTEPATAFSISKPMTEASQEFSQRVLFLSFANWLGYVMRRWYVIIVFALLAGFAGYLVASNIPPLYEAKTVFVLSSDNKTSGLMGLASQLGVDIAAGSKDDVFSSENIISLFKSRLLVQRALFKKLPQSNESLINYYTRVYKLNDKWAKRTRTKNAFPFPEDANAITPVQDSLIKEIHSAIIKKQLDVSKQDKKTSFYEVSTNSIDETFSLNLTRYLVQETKNFYIETKTLTSRQNLSMIQKEADSIRGVLSGTITASAAAADQTFNLNSAYMVNRAPIQQGQARATVLTAAYGEVIKNLEIAKITLQKETPLFQIIDQATSPLKEDKPSKILWFILWGFIAAVIVLLVLSIKWFYHNTALFIKQA